MLCQRAWSRALCRQKQVLVPKSCMEQRECLSQFAQQLFTKYLKTVPKTLMTRKRKIPAIFSAYIHNSITPNIKLVATLITYAAM